MTLSHFYYQIVVLKKYIFISKTKSVLLLEGFLYLLNTICNWSLIYSCLFERFRFINYKTFSRMKVIIIFCKEVINLAVSFNL